MPQSPANLVAEHRYACENCPSTFIRQEHLSRHVRTHTREKPFECSICNKAFARQDVRNRHVHSHEQEQSLIREHSSTRACQHCAGRRVRCSRGLPCRECSIKGLQCTYPTTDSSGKRKAAALSQHDDSQATENTVPTYSMNPEPSLTRNDSLFSDSNFGHSLPAGHASDITQERGLPLIYGETRINNMSPNLEQASSVDSLTDSIIPYEISRGEQSEVTFGMANGLSGQALNILSINWISPEYQATFDWSDQPEEWHNEFRSQKFGFPLDNGQQVPINSHNTPENLHPLNSNIAFSPTPSPDKAQVDTRSTETVASSSVLDQTHGRFYVDGDGARAPFGGIIDKGLPKNILVVDTEVHVGSTAGNLARGTSPPAGEISPEDYNEFLRDIQNEFKESIFNSFPPREYISIWTRLYFEKFHPMFPFIRRTSLVGHGSDWVLHLAVVTVGVCFCKTPQASLFKQFLLNSLQQVIAHRFVPGLVDDHAILWMSPASGNRTTHVNIITLQAAVLNTVCMLHSGNNSKVREALAERFRVVETCHKLSLLLNRTIHLNTAASRSPQALRLEWQQHQDMTRTGLMIWVVDFLISCEFNCRPLMQLTDATAPLPCSEYLWENPNVDLELLQCDNPVTLLQGIEMLYIEKKLPYDLSEFGRILLVYGICRRTKEVGYSSHSQLASWFPSAKVDKRASSGTSEECWPPSTTILSRWRNSACDCLDILHWSANSKAAASAGWEHPTILHLHLSRLLLLTPLAHIQVLANSPISICKKDDRNESHFTKARNHVLGWAIRDQFKARLSVIHAGALFWHVRRYSHDMFMEPYAIYVATLVLWAYCIASRLVKDFSAQQEALVPNNSSPIEGTSLSQNAAIVATQPADDPELPLVYLDRPIDDELVQTYIRSGHKMTGYISRIGAITEREAPSKIIEEGVRLLNSGRAQVSEEGTQILDGFVNVDRPRTWGIECSFIKALQSINDDPQGKELRL